MSRSVHLETLEVLCLDRSLASWNRAVQPCWSGWPISQTIVILITEAEPFDEPRPRILYVNGAFTRMTGYSEAHLLGRNCRVIHGNGTDPLPNQTLREHEMFAAQRLKAVGETTGGIAHDFSNLLTSLSGAAELLEQRPAPDPELAKLVEVIYGAAQRGTS